MLTNYIGDQVAQQTEKLFWSIEHLPRLKLKYLD